MREKVVNTCFTAHSDTTEVSATRPVGMDRRALNHPCQERARTGRGGGQGSELSKCVLSDEHDACLEDVEGVPSEVINSGALRNTWLRALHTLLVPQRFSSG